MQIFSLRSSEQPAFTALLPLRQLPKILRDFTGRPDHGGIVARPLGVPDDADVPAPDMHLWVQSKPEGCAITDDLPQHAANPP